MALEFEGPPAKIIRKSTSVDLTLLQGSNTSERLTRIKSSTSSWSTVFTNGAKLDVEAINFIHRIYCKECRMEEQRKRQSQANIRLSEAEMAELFSSPVTLQGIAGTTSVAMVTSTSDASATGSEVTNVIVEDSPLMDNMNKNKESLKRKLLMRRPVDELRDKGIYPPPKTPPAFAEQRKQLERAKISDSIKTKLSQRPDRKALVDQHILEDTRVDPSLQERQRQLKRARLQDSLSERLAHRPGPLDLIEDNILVTSDHLKDAIKEGKLSFPRAGANSDDALSIATDDTIQSAFDSFLAEEQLLSPVSDVTPLMIPSPPDITPLLQKQSDEDSKFVFSAVPATHRPSSSSSRSSLTSARSSRKSKKKSLGINSSKSKIIKFHEYKGPPNIVKKLTDSKQSIKDEDLESVTSEVDDESQYNVLLQQQQLYLQWQLEFNQKNGVTRQLLMPSGGGDTGPLFRKMLNQSQVKISTTAMKSPPLAPPPPPLPVQVVRTASPAIIGQPRVSLTDNTLHLLAMASSAVVIGSTTNTSASASTSSTVVTSSNAVKTEATTPGQRSSSQSNKQSVSCNLRPTRLEELKVADLKTECKRRNLHVSGPKQNLVERLRSYASEIISSHQAMYDQHHAVSSPASVVSSVTSPPSVAQTASFSIDNNITMSTPPHSPLSASDYNTSGVSLNEPLSPEALMDIAPSASKSQQPNMSLLPMHIDSRPGSAAPMDVDYASPQSLASFQSGSTEAQSMLSSELSDSSHTTVQPLITMVDQNQNPTSGHYQLNMPVSLSRQELMEHKRAVEELEKQLLERKRQLAQAQMAQMQQKQQQPSYSLGGGGDSRAKVTITPQASLPSLQSTLATGHARLVAVPGASGQTQYILVPVVNNSKAQTPRNVQNIQPVSHSRSQSHEPLRRSVTAPTLSSTVKEENIGATRDPPKYDDVMKAKNVLQQPAPIISTKYEVQDGSTGMDQTETKVAETSVDDNTKPQKSGDNMLEVLINHGGKLSPLTYDELNALLVGSGMTGSASKMNSSSIPSLSTPQQHNSITEAPPAHFLTGHTSDVSTSNASSLVQNTSSNVFTASHRTGKCRPQRNKAGSKLRGKRSRTSEQLGASVTADTQHQNDLESSRLINAFTATSSSAVTTTVATTVAPPPSPDNTHSDTLLDLNFADMLPFPSTLAGLEVDSLATNGVTLDETNDWLESILGDDTSVGSAADAGSGPSLTSTHIGDPLLSASSDMHL